MTTERFTNVLSRGGRRDDEVAELCDDGLCELRLPLDDAGQHHAGQLHGPLVGVCLPLWPSTRFQQIKGQLHHSMTHLPQHTRTSGWVSG